MRRLYREPLIHFLILGAALFALNGWMNDQAGSSQNVQDIVVTQGQVRTLADNFEKVWHRTPSREEVDGLVAAYVREEVFYREALALNLDRNDTIIRRRLQQKLEFLSEDLLQPPEPSEDDLQGYLKSHPERFIEDPRLTFEQVYLSSERPFDTIDETARDLQLRLEALKDQEAALLELGDSTILQHSFNNVPTRQVERQFGRDFTRELLEIPTGSWQGPLTSPYGWHLVRITDRTEARLPSLDKIRHTVLMEWRAGKQKEANALFYGELLGKYRVVIEESESDSIGADTDLSI